MEPQPPDRVASAGAHDGWSPNIVSLFIAAVLLLVGASLSSIRFYVMLGYQGNDWGKFYWDAVAWLDHRPMYGVNPATWVLATDTYGQDFYDLAAPHFLLPFLLLAHLGFPAAIAVWVTTTAFGAGLSYWIVARELGGLAKRTVFYLVPILLISDLLGTVVVTAQITFLVMPLVAQTWVWARHERWRPAALGLGLLIAVKPFFALLLPWMAWRGTWRAVPLALAAASAVVGLGLLVFGRSTYDMWVATLAHADWWWLPMNASLRAPLERALTDNPAYAHFVDAPDLALLLWRVAFVALASLVLLLSALDRAEGWRDRAMALLLVSAIFLSPFGWTYYLWWTLPPLLAMLLRNPRPSGTLGWVRNALLCVAALIFATPCLLIPTDTASVLGHLVNGTEFVALSCVWLACVMESARAVRGSMP